MPPRHSKALLDLLTPRNIPGIMLERWGSAVDGGYVVPVDSMEKASLLVSGGVGDNLEFEAEIAARIPSIRIALFDHTVSSLPFHAPASAVWHKMGFGSTPGFITLESAADMAGRNPAERLAVKLDIEGAEWDVIRSTPDDFWSRVTVLVIEFHHLNDKHLWDEYSKILTNLDKHLIPIHAHGNNHDATVHFTRQDVHLPVTLEVTYLNRSLIPKYAVPTIWDHPGPTDLDRPNKSGISDLRLDYWFPHKFPFFRRLMRNVGRMFGLR